MTARYGDHAGPLPVAHRGGAGLAVENTASAVSRSHALGVRAIEVDVRITRDSALIAFHDRALHRLVGRPGRIADLTLRELASLRIAGQRIPLLADLFTAYPDCSFLLDLKDRGCVNPLAQLLRADPAVAARVCVAAPWESWLTELRNLAGPVTTALAWRALAGLSTRFPRIARSSRSDPPRAAYAHLPVRLGRVPIFKDDVVRRAHDRGLRVLVWTVNDASTMHRLLDARVDGIITDRPDVLREVLLARGQWLAPGPEPRVPYDAKPGNPTAWTSNPL